MKTREHTTSRDGTRIAFERTGHGEPLILVSPALHSGAAYRPLAEQLAPARTVVHYDRRGRGDSGDTPPYAVEREVEDLAAVIAATGGTASVYGHSSGAGLVLHAAARGLPIDRIVLHEPPFGTDTDEERRTEDAEAERIAGLLAQRRDRDALRFFLTSMGLPTEAVDHLSGDPTMLANARTLPYDPYEIMSARSRGGRTPTEQAGDVSVPALVLAGTASPPWLVDASRRIADALPGGVLRLLDGHEHVVPAEILAPVLIEFLT